MNPLAQLMSFVRRKLVKGIPYLYEVESYRDPQTGKVKQRTLCYLGRDPQHPKPKKLGTTTRLFNVGDRVMVAGCLPCEVISHDYENSLGLTLISVRSINGLVLGVSADSCELE